MSNEPNVPLTRADLGGALNAHAERLENNA
jgi:hypothetical protein